MAGEETLFGKELLAAMKRMVDRYTQPDNLTIFRNPAGKLAARAGAAAQSFGAWTPAFASTLVDVNAMAGGTFQYVSQLGDWTRIGSLVFATCQMNVRMLASPTAGGLVIGGLPFAAKYPAYGTLQVNNLRFPESYVSTAGVAMTTSLCCNTASNSTGVQLTYDMNGTSGGLISRLALGPSIIIGLNFSIVYEATYGE